MKKINYCIVALQLFFCLAIAQKQEPFKVTVIPPSPEAAQLAKYEDIPVGLYSGTPNISIPIYTVNERGLTLPISLNHHASAHKVETVAPRTGMGWSLNAGGVVTRSLRGLPDEFYNGTLQGFLARAEFLKPQCEDSTEDCIETYWQTTPMQERYEVFKNLADGCWDAEPDLFYFNVSGFTGSFQFDWHGNIIISSEHNIKVRPVGLEPKEANYISGWELTMPNGVKYIFNTQETQINRQPFSLSNLCNSTLNDLEIPQSWFLTEMHNPNTEGHIFFEYDPYVQKTTIKAMATITHNLNADGSLQAGSTQGDQEITMEIKGKYLRKISTSSGQTTIDFVEDTTRKRTDPGIENSESSPLYPLGAIRVTNNNNKEVDQWKLSYYNDDDSINRLTLKSLQKKSANNSVPPYKFEYEGRLPHTNSYKQDHWGFYNGRNAQTLVPEAKYRGQTLSGANRSPNSSKITNGMIKRIIYPTGGIDEFTFEPHDYSFIQNNEVFDTETDWSERTKAVSVPNSQPDPGSNNRKEERIDIPEHWVPLRAEITTRFINNNFGGVRQHPRVSIIDEEGTEIFVSQPVFPGKDNSGAPYVISKFEVNIPDSAVGKLTLVATTRVPHGTIDDLWERITMNVTWKVPNTVDAPVIAVGGGSRIAKIERSYGFGNPNKVIQYEYRMVEDGRIKSSGSLLETIKKHQTEQIYCDYATPECNTKLIRSAQNRTALGTTQGSQVGYRQVSVVRGELGENGKSIHYFSSPYTIQDIRSDKTPFPPAVSNDYKRGLLKKQEDYNHLGNLVHELNHTYQYREKRNRGLKIGWKRPSANPELEGPKDPERLILGLYYTVLGFSKLIRTEEITYFGDTYNQPFKKLMEYAYKIEPNPLDYYSKPNPDYYHKKLIQESTTESEGKKIITQYKYPLDYARGTTTVIDKMKDRHLIGSPLEKLTLEELGDGELYLLSAQKTEYDLFENHIQPHQIYTAKIAEPILVTTDPYTIANSVYEPRFIFDKYNQFGNLLQQSQPHGSSIAYIWNNKGTLPVAQVIGAQPSQVFHTSFEENGVLGSGGTGVKYHNGSSYIIPQELRPQGSDLVMTYWFYKSGKWQIQEEKPYNPEITHNGANGLDEIRVYPKGAQMTSYTHDPLVGITSITDPNNITSYFSYDDQERLTTIKDLNKNIMQYHEYNFKQN